MQNFADLWASWTPAFCLPDQCFCEAVRDGGIAQPVNTWSGLIFVVIGLVILLQLVRDQSGKKTEHNRMTTTIAFPIILAVILVLLGLSTAFYHASLTRIGGALDTGSMFLLASMFILYNLSRRYHLSPKTFWVLFVVVNIPLGLAAWYDSTVTTRYIFGFLIGLVLISEGLVWMKRKPTIAIRYLWAALGMLLLAFVIWIFDILEIICAPTSWLQLHALWHLLTATAAGLMYYYYRSEDTKEQPNRAV